MSLNSKYKVSKSKQVSHANIVKLLKVYVKCRFDLRDTRWQEHNVCGILCLKCVCIMVVHLYCTLE